MVSKRIWSFKLWITLDFFHGRIPSWRSNNIFPKVDIISRDENDGWAHDVRPLKQVN